MTALSHPYQALASLLHFYQDSGVDAFVGEAPVNRFSDPGEKHAEKTHKSPTILRQQGQSSQQVSAKPTQAPPVGMAIAADAAIEAARRLAADARDLTSLRQAMLVFDGCALRATATHMIFAAGPLSSRIMLIGDTPSRDDDVNGAPFSGQAGLFLGKALGGIGLDLPSIYMTHLIPWRPPGNREPTAHEIALCLPFIQRHIALKQPDYVICLGEKAAQALLNIRDGIMKVRGQWLPLTIEGHTARALATLHPDYCLRSPLAKKLMWRDLLRLKTAYKNTDHGHHGSPDKTDH